MKKIQLSPPFVHSNPVHENYMDYAKPVEKQRLEQLDERIDRQKRILGDTVKDRLKIRRRLIRRMRRATGKE